MGKESAISFWGLFNSPMQNAENRDESPLPREKTSKCMKLFCAIKSFFAYFTLYNRWILLYNEIV